MCFTKKKISLFFAILFWISLPRDKVYGVYLPQSANGEIDLIIY